jgi:hypothetical protein
LKIKVTWLVKPAQSPVPPHEWLESGVAVTISHP